jgi:hypothetical protein
VFNAVADANGTYAPSKNPKVYNYLTLPALTADNAPSMIQPITIAVSEQTFSLSIDISCVSPNAVGAFWAVSDVVVLA